jgi:quinoprotein glucose dehydrogenase
MKSSFLKFYLIGLFLIASCQTKKQDFSEWRIYRGGSESNAYSGLQQINRQNVAELAVAWVFQTEDSGPAIQCNPIVVNNIMYITSPALKVMALNPATGELLWKFDPFDGGTAKGVNRGVTYWEMGKDKRIFFTAAHYLYALNALNGSIIDSFGINGKVDLRIGLGKNPEKVEIESTSPGIIHKNNLIIGSMVSENEGAAPGHVRAFDAITGQISWIFHTIPQPGEYGYEQWEPEAWKEIGGANVWSGFSLDEKRGWVFLATGSCSPDFYGGDRKGSNLFANSVIALNASNGKRIWHYQIVHHDLWDYDLPTPPNLVTVTHSGKLIEAVAQLTKTGNVFLFNRENGEPLFPIEERPVPQSDIFGEDSYPTQPFPLLPPSFVRQKYTEDDITDISPGAREYAIERLSESRNTGIFTPPSLEGSVVFPGMRGGAEWSGGSFDYKTGILYVNANEIPNIMSLKRIDTGNKDLISIGKNLYQINCATCHGIDRKGQPPFPSLQNVSDKLPKKEILDVLNNGRGQMPAFPNLSSDEKDAIMNYLVDAKEEKTGTERRIGIEKNIPEKIKYAHSGYGQFLDQDGYPAVRPPWGTLNAINLNTGEILWKVPLGEYPELTQKGIPVTGTQNFGGSLVTAGGLLFIGGSKDEKFRAFDKDTGEILWETILPAGGYATPATYQINGKQFVVVAAGGGGRNATKKGDAFVAFSLPVK